MSAGARCARLVHVWGFFFVAVGIGATRECAVCGVARTQAIRPGCKLLLIRKRVTPCIMASHFPLSSFIATSLLMVNLNFMRRLIYNTWPCERQYCMLSHH